MATKSILKNRHCKNVLKVLPRLEQKKYQHKYMVFVQTSWFIRICQFLPYNLIFINIWSLDNKYTSTMDLKKQKKIVVELV